MSKIKKYIEVSLGNHTISHGYDAKNKEITEYFSVEGFSKKIIALDRIKSVSEKYILTDYLDGRWIYWEYQEEYQEIKSMLGV